MYLIFDCYGTLVEMDNFYGRLTSGFARLGQSLPSEAIRCAAHSEMRHYMSRARHAVDPASFASIRQECANVLSAALAAQGYRLPLSQAAVAQVLFDAVAFRPFVEVRQTLEELRRRGFRLGVLSNWDFRLPYELETLRLGHLFDFVLTSAGLGFEKPDRGFFDAGLRTAQFFEPEVTARDCHYIGDHFEKDVLGARGAGMSPLWLVRDRRDLTSGEIHDCADPVPRLGSLCELLNLFPVQSR